MRERGTLASLFTGISTRPRAGAVVVMKSLQEIRDEYLDQMNQEKATLDAKVDEARHELNVLFEKAGISDRPDILADDSDKWSDDDYYRRKVRDRVFSVPDIELRKQIMRQFGEYRYQLYGLWLTISLFDDRFADRLRHERCSPPQPSRRPVAAYFVIVGLAYWLGGALDALVLGAPGAVFLALEYIIELYRHEVIFQEAIKYVERQAAVSKGEATRRLHLPELFSRREIRTGEADEATA